MSKSQEFYFVFQNNNVAILNQASPFNGKDIAADQILRQFKIGTKATTDYSVIEVSKDFQLPTQVVFVSLKPALAVLGEALYPLVSGAYQILFWDIQHQFCGACGEATRHNANTLEKQCTVCGAIYYPRIAPSIIVRIRKDDQILMARSPHFVPGVYGLIAGFVEPGENLEEAVRREVAEEVNIKIDNIHYFGSQSWPFPNTMMIAFTADYVSGEIEIDKNEIEAAGWFDTHTIPGRPSFTYSIATKLIQDFITGVSLK